MQARSGVFIFVAFLFLVFLPGPGADLCGQSLLDRGEPRIYTGEHLEAVGMPVGGIGTGNIWIGGDGLLPVWQIFNNLTEDARVPDSFFAVRAQARGGEPRLFALEQGIYTGFEMARVRCFRADYPFAWLEFECEGLPVDVSLEVFNPMIPLNLEDSSIPCAIFSWTAHNPGNVPVDVSFAAMLQNAVGYDGYGDIISRYFWGYGGNLNTVEHGDDHVRILLDVPDRNPPRFMESVSLLYHGDEFRVLRTCENLDVKRLPARGPAPDTDAVWVRGISLETDRRLLDAIARKAESGGVVSLTRAEASFLNMIVDIRAAEEAGGWTPEYVLFEDFESGDYDGWTVEGEAFGEKPHTGTSPKQQPVDGFMGEGLVNTFVPDDGPHGTLTSRPFRVEHRYIGFLIGGGNHEGRTCINLKVDGRVVRTATGKNNEYLEFKQWDVADFRLEEAVIEIVDRESGGWGHVNIDQIVFSELPPAALIGKEEALRTIARLLPLERNEKSGFSVKGWETTVAKPEGSRALPVGWKGLFDRATMWLRLGEGTAEDFRGIANTVGVKFDDNNDGLPPESPLFGEMCLSVLDEGAHGRPDWSDYRELADDLRVDGLAAEEKTRSLMSRPGETRNCALAAPFTLEPGAERTVTFIVAWRFPNLERFGHRGNLYAERFASAAEVEQYVRENFDRLLAESLLYRDTLYETNLPYWMLECLSSQACIFRTNNCFFAARHKDTGEPYFAGYEGCYGCCPLNCTHVWNYAQTHARLFPEIGRNLRRYDFNHYLKESGETQHRQHRPYGAFIDGHCAVLEGAYREHLMSPDDAFLREIWPGVRMAAVWLIDAIDPDEDGVNSGHQWNTYDVATGGAHTFIGSQYLSAMFAVYMMARAVGDDDFAERCHAIRIAGRKNQDELLWNEDFGYYIQIPDEKPARDYNTGCHADQLLGQWWAHMLGTGYLYPSEHVRTALESIYKHNLLRDFTRFRQRPRRYVVDGEGGLLMCTWPHGGRPDPFILYADEVWTGIEYSTAALMIYEGMIEEAFDIVKTARDRYDGRLRQGLNSGPGGNPFCELECGRFYARALSSWSLLLAAQGFHYGGPDERIGFVPRWSPGNHSSFFCAAEGWGLFSQRDEGRTRVATIDVRHGRVPVQKLVLSRPNGFEGRPEVEMRLGDEVVRVKTTGFVDTEGFIEQELWFTLKDRVVVTPGDKLEVRMTW